MHCLSLEASALFGLSITKRKVFSPLYTQTQICNSTILCSSIPLVPTIVNIFIFPHQVSSPLVSFTLLVARGPTSGSSREPKKPPLYKCGASNFSSQDVDKDHFIEPYSTTKSDYVDIEKADGQSYQQDCPYHSGEKSPVHIDSGWTSQPVDLTDEEDDVTVADVAAPYWQRAVGPTWWCHVAAGHPSVNAWLSNAQWLHPAISIALRDESKLISERMNHLLYEVLVRVAGGLLFEILGQLVGDPYVEEDDVPAVIRSWQAQNFLLTALHVKGSASNINVIGIAEVQELLVAGSYNIPRTIHEVVALLACRLARWDDRLLYLLI